MSCEILMARNECRIIRCQGRSLASTVDPLNEARLWLEKNHNFVAGEDRLVVLGVGAGYHLRELTQRFPHKQIFALYIEDDLLESLNKLHALELSTIEFVHIAKVEEALAIPRLRRLLSQNYGLLSFLPAQATYLQLYRELQARLVARDPVLFSDLVRREPRLLKMFPLQAIPGAGEKTLLSIKDLTRMVTGNGDLSRQDLLLLKALRELVV